MIASFLRAELAPSRARWRATGRVVVACVLATTVIMSLHMSSGYWVLISILIVSQPNAGASLVRGIQRVIASLAGAAAAIFVAVAFPQQPWFELASVGLLCGGGLFLSQTTTAPYVGILLGVTPALLLGLAGPDPGRVIDESLWRALAIALGVVIGTAVQILVWPEDPEEALLDDLASALERVRDELLRLTTGGANTEERLVALRNTAFQALGGQMDWLAHAEALHFALRRRHAEQLVVIGSVHRLATATLALGQLLSGREAGLDDFARARLGAVAGRCDALCARLRREPVSHAPVPPGGADPGEGSRPNEGIAGPALLELERALSDLQAGAGFLGEPAPGATAVVPASPLDRGDGPFYFTPAFSLSNGPAVRFALKGGLAAMICMALVDALHEPGLGTAVVTAVVVSQTSVGAMVQKAALRLAGAIAGGVLGLATLVYGVPMMDSLASLLVVTAVCMGIAGYVLAGSARISYAGMQLGLAWVLTMLGELHPSTGLLEPLERVLGILLGILVTGFVYRFLAPVFASVGMRDAVVSALRHMAELSRFGLPAAPGEVLERPSGGFRWQVTQDFATAMRLAAESRLEPQSRHDASRAVQEAGLRVLDSAQSTFLALLAVVRHRTNAGPLRSPAAPHEALLALGRAVDPFLRTLAIRVQSGEDAPAGDLDALLARAEHLVSDLAASHDPQRAPFETRVALYQTLVAHLDRLDERSRAFAHQAAAARAA